MKTNRRLLAQATSRLGLLIGIGMVALGTVACEDTTIAPGRSKFPVPTQSSADDDGPPDKPVKPGGN